MQVYKRPEGLEQISPSSTTGNEEGVEAGAPRIRGSATRRYHSVGWRTGGRNVTGLLSTTSAAHPGVQGQKSTCSRSGDSTSAKPASERRSISRDACFEREVVDQERPDIGQAPCSRCAFLLEDIQQEGSSWKSDWRGIG